ncbi:MAG: DNA recombination protein RmuC [Clostridia bacterium]|nr:DNA recombination protein RmuC [Clostridia bacterium]
MDYILAAMMFIVIALLVVLIINTNSKKNSDNSQKELKELGDKISSDLNDKIALLSNVQVQNQNNMSQALTQSMSDMDRHIKENQELLRKSVLDSLNSQEARFKTFSLENEQKLDNIRASVERRLAFIQQDNNKRLDEMRQTVDEKLQKTLDEKLTGSFKMVNDRLEQVYKGLGEMQSLAMGVGDLKKILSNVKTRGILGEIQLGAILKEILSTEQYCENIATKKGSREVVEFAVKLPATDDSFVYLPIDSKFPADTYQQLYEAYELGDKELIALRKKALRATVRSEAKDIYTKYVCPPQTTDFAIMFLPFEGLYSEVVNMGLVEELQRDFKVNIAGPSTMAAMLNSLQMGFRTLAVQKRSAEVWDVLGAVKTEFNKFEGVLAATQQRLDQANKELDALVGVRTRQIQRKLNSVSEIPEIEASALLDDVK